MVYFIYNLKLKRNKSLSSIKLKHNIFIINISKLTYNKSDKTIMKNKKNKKETIKEEKKDSNKNNNKIYYQNENIINKSEAIKLIINNEEHIKDEYESNTLVLLFYYYYSILTYSLLKNTNYVCKSNLTDNFQDYVKQKLDLLYDDDEYTSKFNNLYDNQYISLHLNELNNYAERARNMKLDYYIRYIQFLLSIYEDDNPLCSMYGFDVWF